jgi:hypothetical protein
MAKNCPCCGLALRETTAVCPLCNERLIRLPVRGRYILSALLALEVAAVIRVLA